MHPFSSGRRLILNKVKLIFIISLISIIAAVFIPAVLFLHQLYPILERGWGICKSETYCKQNSLMWQIIYSHTKRSGRIGQRRIGAANSIRSRLRRKKFVKLCDIMPGVGARVAQ